MISSTTTDFGRGIANWHQIGSLGPDIHFAPANGLPFKTYASFLRHLASKYTICGVDNRAVWPEQGDPPAAFDWHNHAEDLIAFLEYRYTQPIIGVGHSIGATVSLIAAIKRPDLFRSLVLIEPATVPNTLADLAMRVVPGILKKQLPIVKRARLRRPLWDSHQQFIDHHKTRRAFADLTEEAFADYASGGLAATEDDKLRLVFPPEWEAHNFLNVASIWNALNNIRVSTLLLRAERTYMYKQSYLDRREKRFSPTVSCQSLKGLGHLAPQQAPEHVASVALNWIRASHA